VIEDIDMNHPLPAIGKRVRAIVAKTLVENGIRPGPSDLADDAVLSQIGADDHDMTLIVRAMEAEFGIGVSDDGIDPSATIADLVRAVTPAEAA
jgi:acyl carrier protein